MTDEIDALLAEREKTHGNYLSHAIIVQGLKKKMRDTAYWYRISPQHKESLEMIAHKIARILAGDPNHKDHWDDIAGYARLGANSIKK